MMNNGRRKFGHICGSGGGAAGRKIASGSFGNYVLDHPVPIEQ